MEFSAHILAFDGYFLHAYYVLGTEDRAVSWEQVLLFQKLWYNIHNIKVTILTFFFTILTILRAEF